MLAQNWEEGLSCRGCGLPVAVGAPVLYGYHPACRAAAGGGGSADAVQAAAEALEAGGRVSLPKKHLRALAEAACTEPVRRPDRGARGIRWYGRLPGWSAARVESGLSLAEACGLWLDALDTGRTPPVSHEHLRMITQAAALSRPAASAPAPARRTAAAPAG